MRGISETKINKSREGGVAESDNRWRRGAENVVENAHPSAMIDDINFIELVSRSSKRGII